MDMTSSFQGLRANRKVIQKGFLNVTHTSLVFTDDVSQMKQSWPLKSLRNFEVSSDNVFVIETADSSSDARVFSFSTPEAKQLQNLVLHYMQSLINSEQPHLLGSTFSVVSPLPVFQTPPTSADGTPPTHWQLNTSLSMESSSSASTISPTHSRTSSNSRDIFEVDRILEDSSKRERGILEAVENEIVFVESVGGGGGGKRFAWPTKCLRRYGYEGDIFTLEVGRKAPGGEGRYIFKTSRAVELNAAVKSASSGRISSPSPAATERSNKTHGQHFLFGMQRGLLPPPPLQPPLPLLPSQASPHPLAPLPPPRTQPQRYARHSFCKQQQDTEDESDKLSKSSPTFSRSDSLIRRAYSNRELRHNVFEVRNISDDKREVGHGTVEVTATDLIYVDASTHERWKWPVRFLRKYGFEENIFSFEAGRRCPGGEGLYAFVSERANEIHETMLECVRDQSKHGAMPARASLTPENTGAFMGVVSSHSRLSLVDDQVTSPPVVKLANKNHFDKNHQDNSNVNLMRTGLVHQPPATSTLSVVHPVQMTTPNSVESGTTSPDSVGVDHSSMGTKLLSNDTAATQLQPVQARVKPIVRSHLYEVPTNFDPVSNRRRSHDKQTTSANGVVSNESVAPKVNSEQRKGSLSPGDKKRYLKSDQKTLSLNNPEVSNGVSISEDVFAKDTLRKPRSNVLDRLIGKKKSKKERRDSVDTILHTDSYLDQPKGSEGGVYSNIHELGRVRSASCDDILSSCNLPDSHSTSMSAVPLPQSHHSQTTPTNGQQMKNGSRQPEQDDVSIATTSGLLYQNLNDIQTHDGRHSHPVQAPPTSAPPSSSFDHSHLYSNIPLLKNQICDNPPPQNRTMYAEVEICQTTPPLPVSPHTSLSPRLPFSSTAAGITVTINKPTLFAKPKILPKPSPRSDRRRSSSLLSTDTVSDKSGHVLSQSASFSSGKIITPRYEVDSGPSDDPVLYAPLDYLAMKAVAQIKRDHTDISYFDEVLKRHDIREMEMDRKKRRHVVT